MSAAIADFVGDSGTCVSESETLLSAINDIRRLFYPKTEYFTLREWVDICCVNKCFYLPGRYEVVRSVIVCGVPMTLQNEWYQLTHAGSDDWTNQPCLNVAEDRGRPNCKFREYTEAPFYIEVYSESNADEGVELQFEFRTATGRWKKETVQLKDSFTWVRLSEECVTYSHITKPVTKGAIRVRANDPTNSITQILAIHQPWEVNPMYKRYVVGGACGQIVRVNAKLKYHDLTGQLDLVEFPVDAMIHGALALNYRRKREMVEFQNELALAFAELNSDMAGKETQGSTPLRMHLGTQADNLIQYGFCGSIPYRNR